MHRTLIRKIDWVSMKNTDCCRSNIPISLACGIDTNLPGEYNITYSVTNSLGFTGKVDRTLVVSSICEPGEKLCSNKVRQNATLFLHDESSEAVATPRRAFHCGRASMVGLT